MPIYEYRCEKCGDFEETQRISDPPLNRCPTCRRKVKRLISSTSFQLKGSGWYVTDYARAGQSKQGKESDKDGSKDSSKDSAGASEASSKAEAPSATNTKTETKTETKSNTKSETKAAS